MVAAGLMSLAACGGGGGSDAATVTGSTTTAAAAVAAPAPPAGAPAAAATGTQTPAAVAAALNIDFANVPNYVNPTLPAYYDAMVQADDNAPADPAASDRVALLGRVLFHDKTLSVNARIACASCHQPASGFADPARFSTGFSGAAFTTAHSMRLGNVRYYAPGSMFWDKRAASLEAQASQPIQNSVEMGFDAAHGGIPALLAALRATSYYGDLFSFAFGDATITESRVQTALAQFERAMVSTGSRWDQAYAQVFNAAAPGRNLDVPLPGFSDQENRGRHLFMANRGAGGLDCANCHEPPTFALTGNSGSNGLDAGETVRFKSPSLKNVARSGAFMHDGRFATLEQVIEHYDHGVQAGPALDNRLRVNGGAPRVLALSADDKAALVAFLRTLDDPALNADTRFSSPFR